MKFILCLIIVLLSFQFVCAQYVYPKRELRGVWIATISDIDWPSSNHDSSQKQIAELKHILVKLKEAGINSVFFQVRTECDALYKSKYEPWSYWLTGEQGKAPNPFFDPLQVAIDEAHKMGMELHAWLNPLRVEKQFDNYKIASNNVMVKHPEWILKFKNYKMLNPGLPAVRNYVSEIVADILRRYKVDGIHFDDYFYPYEPKILNEDRKTFLNYKGDFKNIDEWRRNNINLLVAQVHDTIEEINPNVKFGISPFGIVENKFADTKGFESFKILYCDPITWIKNKSIDYIIPQIYWAIGNKAADYSKLLLWWASIADGVQLYIGAYSSKLASPNYKGNPDEIEKQLKLNRQIIHVDGTVFFSAKSITQNYSGLADSLKIYFKHPSLLPLMKWKDSLAPRSPLNLSASAVEKGIKLSWLQQNNSNEIFNPDQIVIYRFSSVKSIDIDDGSHIQEIVNADENNFVDTTADVSASQIVYVVTAVDKFGNESKPAIVVFRKPEKSDGNKN